MIKELAFFDESVRRELSALGTDDAIYVVSCLASLAKAPASFARWNAIRILPMPEAGAHCVKIEIDEPGGDFQGASCLAAIEGDALVVLGVGSGFAMDAAATRLVAKRYAALEAEASSTGARLERWPPVQESR